VKIYTKTGDAGDTGLFGGQRVSKGDLRVWAYGEVDEANSYLGVIRSGLGSSPVPGLDLDGMLRRLQDDLMVAGSDLATPVTDAPDNTRVRRLESEHVARLEGWIDTQDATLPQMTSFILPGGALIGAQLILARTVVRRAERAAVVLVSSGQKIGEHVIPYLNRLSDLLFVLGRVANQNLGASEEPWGV
jgi:cob(I)alamin adenosyltransferase